MYNKKSKLLTILIALLAPSSAFAKVTIGGLVDGLVQTTLRVASGVIVILWVVTGVIFLTAQGQPDKVSTGKKSLLAAIAGTILVIVASGAIPLVKDIFGM